MIKVGIVGGTGYTGVELMRLLAGHSGVEVVTITSRSESGIKVADVFPSLRGVLALSFVEPDLAHLQQCDVVFFATPNGTAMKMAASLLASGVKVIDLAADFRIKDLAVWEQWYGMKHEAPELVSQAVYGLPEVNREAIKQASLVANPGCYPTAAQLGFLPLLERNIILPHGLIADCKSGVSGAGRGSQVGSLLSEVSESIMAYAASGHRHLPEIKQGLEIAANKELDLTFVPHLTPMIRGIHATLYAELETEEANLQELYEQRYSDEPFVDVLPAGSHPSTNSVKGINHCRIAIHRPGNGRRVVVLSVIDNLVKGAAGQAVHNMNLMFGLPESTGLAGAAIFP